MTIYRKDTTMLHSDRRGDIYDLIPKGETIKGALYITGVKGSVRANHYHKEDSHYCLVVSGKIKYVYKDVGEAEAKVEYLEPGDIVYTPPFELHRFVFLTNGVFLALSTKGRTQKSYEQDTIRENF